ncbi:MAG: type II secretion system F family protein [Candidatus Pacearchaeota archaeon]|jgi:flagellar protein FlaJ
MSLQVLKVNALQEKKLLDKLNFLLRKNMMSTDLREKRVIENAIIATQNQMRILNNSIPLLLNNISLARRLPQPENLVSLPKPIQQATIKKELGGELITLKQELEGSETLIAIAKRDKNEYLKQLQITNDSLKHIKKKEELIESFDNEYKKPNGYVTAANKIFSESSKKYIEGGYFNWLKISLKRGGFQILPSSYVSVIFLTTFLAFFIGIILTIILVFFQISITPPFIALSQEITQRLIKFGGLVLGIPILTFLALYIYPSTEKSSIEKDIDYELPFATIQMSAIASADIEPSNIFRIIALNKEYPSIRQEAKKVMNQINLYGYDLITALRNVAMSSPSHKWADLLNGFSTTIRSGGDLGKYLGKKAETMLFEYKLKKEKSTKAAETFMNVYISIVIAAPMLLMLVLVMLNVSGIGFSMPISILTLVAVGVVSLINVVFIAYLHVSQKRI